MRSNPRSTPGPRGRHLLAALRLLQQDPLAFLLEMTQVYGDIIHLPLRVMDVYILNAPQAIQHILQDNHRNYNKDTFQYNLLAGITGRGLLTADGEAWLRQRRLVQPAFHRSRIAALDGLVTEAAARMLARWEPLARAGEPVDIDAEMMRLALEIVGQALFSVDLSASAGELTGAVLTTLDYLVYRARNPFSPPTFLPTRRNRAFRAALRTLDAAVYGLIRARHGRLSAASTHAQPGLEADSRPADLLEMLLIARDPESGAGLTEQQVRDEVITLLIAGHETVASALTWAWYLLAQNPNAAEKLYDEVHTTLGGRGPAAGDLANLPYTQRAFEEALRLYPPAWIITRKALGPDEVCGHPIRAGGLVILSPYTIHRHPDFWERPGSFEPERFDPTRAAGRPRYAYIPFGGGPRLCIGDGFARFEASLILASVAQRYRLTLADAAPPNVEALVTLRPRHGLKLLLQPVSRPTVGNG